MSVFVVSSPLQVFVNVLRTGLLPRAISPKQHAFGILHLELLVLFPHTLPHPTPPPYTAVSLVALQVKKPHGVHSQKLFSEH